ncbi:hypothetical protein RFI_05906 [Reticulomyxa filosa]|uniref:AAA+ ATPase domain-containing protein n=2 Tax=Reticulomyxa filosa TaxID=46433 RepID=X6P0Z3_RETFI|nr:hypothetical protein RFI_05906 [Reticulomyxa filosa]|eukprot:ETO31217.1 hypothetical protein RFI_05906 [Reticulomyxa filosa]
MEQLECFLNRSTDTNLQTSVVGRLHCLVLPELLTRSIQQQLIKILPSYTRKPRYLLVVISTNSQCFVAQELSLYRNTEIPILQQQESKEFYSTVFCDNFEKFREKQNNAPFVTVFFSQQPCVGKSYTISQWAKKLDLKPKCFVHVPINTFVVDTDFIVNRLLQAPSTTDDLIVFHINISSQAGKDVNTLMFQLLVLRYIVSQEGKGFTVRKNHAFLVELPTELSNTHKNTSLTNVFDWFYFFGDRIKDLSIPFLEIIDEMRIIKPRFDKFEINKFHISPKEMFVLKYLDALDTDLLKPEDISTKEVFMITYFDQSKLKTQNDWDYTKHPDINKTRMMELITKYASAGTRSFNMFIYIHTNCNFCPINYYYYNYYNVVCDVLAKESLVQLKSFLQFLYKQLVQLNQFLYIKRQYAPSDKRHLIPLHVMIATSLVKFAAHIACDTYEGRNGGEVDEDEKSKDIEEAEGKKEFLLVQLWKKADPPMVLFNQLAITDSVQIHMQKTSLDEDLKLMEKKMEHTLSLLSVNLRKNKHLHADEWRLLMKQYSWDLYNFEDEDSQYKPLPNTKKNEEKEKEKKDLSDQMKKLQLLLQICGGFTSKHEEKREEQMEEILKKHGDYALTFDNILKMVAIFFRIKSGIPVLIMGETGCGKTKLLKVMADVLGLEMASIDVHGGYTIQDLQNDLAKPLKQAKERPEITHLIFLDEINTSPEISTFKEVICDHSLNGEVFPDNIVVIAALHPYRSHHRSQDELKDEKEEEKNIPKFYLDDLDKEMCQLVYRVFPLPKSLRAYVWNFGSLSASDEKQYIAVMTSNTWTKQEFLGSTTISPQQLDELKTLFVELICISQKFVRDSLKDRSVCSLRDVRRANSLFLWFFKNRETIGTAYSILEAITLSLAQCYYYRLNQPQREKYNKLISTETMECNTDIKLDLIVKREQDRYIRALTIPPGIATNRAFSENLFVMLVGLATKTPTIIVGRPGFDIFTLSFL